MLDGEVRSASVEALVDGELLALPAGEVRALLARHPEITREAGRRPRPPPAHRQRADLPPVVPDRPQPRRRRALPARRRGGAARRRRRRGDDPHEPGRPRPARRHLAGERQPLPRRPRARRHRAPRPRPGHRARPAEAATTTSTRAADAPDRTSPRFGREMVERQLRRRGIDDERVLAAMGRCPASCSCRRACAAAPTPTRRCRSARGRRSPSPGSSPRSARRCGSSGGERVLEVGTGSGYSAAVLALLAREVIGIERQPELAARRRAGAGRARRRQRRGGRRRRRPRPARAGAVRRDRRPRRRAGAAAEPCSSSSARAVAWWPRSPPARPTC